MTSALALLAGLLAAAAAWDVGQRRIPNALVALLAAAGLVTQLEAGGVRGAGRGLLAAAIVLAVLALAWVRGKLGAGDVKLAAAAALWVGPERVVEFLLLAGVAGLPVAVAARVAHRLRQRRLLARISTGGAMLDEVVRSRETVPMAVAIAIGALVAAARGLR